MSVDQVMSVVGYFVLLAIGYALSRNRKAVQLKLVLWGVGLQWLMAALLLMLIFMKSHISEAVAPARISHIERIILRKPVEV